MQVKRSILTNWNWLSLIKRINRILDFFSFRPQDIDFHVPPEYLVNVSIREKLSLSMSKYKDDLLFFLFYTNVGDAMQLAAAVELYVNHRIIEIHSIC